MIPPRYDQQRWRRRRRPRRQRRGHRLRHQGTALRHLQGRPRHARFPIEKGQHYGLHRPFGLRQEHGAPLPEPHERPGAAASASRGTSTSTAPTSTIPASTPWPSAAISAWSSSSRIPFAMSIYRNVTFGLRLNGYKGNKAEKVEAGPPRRRPSGTRSRTSCTRAPWPSPAASSSGCASPGPSPPSRRCCSWTSPVRRSTPSPRGRSKS